MLSYNADVIGVAIEGIGDDQGGGLGMLIPATTNIYEATSLGLRAKVELPNGYVRIELADVSGQLAVWCMNYDTGEYMKLVDSQSSPTREFPISAWRRIAGCNPDNSMPSVQAKTTSSSPGSATLRFRYWNPDGGLFIV